MNELIIHANKMLKSGGFEYAICGGYAIDLFLNRNIRKHSDIDVSVCWKDRDRIILFMKSMGWDIYEMCGGGKAHHISDIRMQLKLKRNIFCFKDDCDLINLTALDEKDMYNIDFKHCGQEELNFIEYLFNDRNEDSFIYARNKEITLPVSKAVMTGNEIPYLAPELVLLYKSTDTEREGYQLDFDTAIAKMSNEQKEWLQIALKALNPSGHKWIFN
jgi:hypothetical protein